MTHPTDEELDALVGMLQQRDKSKHGYTGHPLYNRNGPQAVDAIAALRAQLADARAERDYDRRQSDHKSVIIDKLNSMLTREKEAHAAANARADRAEAALAAQIEADAGLVREYEAQIAKWAMQNGTHMSAYEALTEIAHAIRNQPHDRAALDRMLRAEREKALREAGSVAYRICAETRHVTLGQKAEAAILAMIEQPKETK